MSDEDERDEDREDEGAEESAAEGSESASSSASASGDTEDTSADDDSDDGDDGDAEAAAPAAATSSPAAAAALAAKAKAKAKGAASAGARLAAAKAAKAAAKAAKKQARKEEAGAATPTAAEREQEDLERTESAEAVLRESPLGRAATNAADWAQQNRQIATGLAAVVVLALVGWVGWTWWSTSQATAAGELLAEALEISSAEIVAPSDDEADEGDEASDEEADDAPTYATIADRNDAALVAYRRVSSEYPGSAAAAWARLGEGRVLLAQGENEDARTAYQAAFDASHDEPVVAWQALEGIGATYEAEQDWEHATSTYERLAALNDHAYENVANYHLARMRAARGETSEALAAFRELVDALRDANDEGGEPEFPYVLAQADERLRELDPSAAGAGPRLGGGGGAEGAPSGLEDLSPEQLQELIRRLQAQSAGGGGDAPAPE
ncbi:MAG: hypothetical protein U0234_03240 [Sandaracinus sp.]